MGFRYLLLGLAIWALLLIIRHLIRQKRLTQQGPKTAKAVDSVQCGYCGLHLPRGEAVQQGEDYYCSHAHQQAANDEK